MRTATGHAARQQQSQQDQGPCRGEPREGRQEQLAITQGSPDYAGKDQAGPRTRVGSGLGDGPGGRLAQVRWIFPGTDRGVIREGKQPGGLRGIDAAAEAEIQRTGRADREPGVLPTDDARPTARDQGKNEQARCGPHRHTPKRRRIGETAEHQVARHRDKMGEKEWEGICLGEVRKPTEQATGGGLPG